MSNPRVEIYRNDIKSSPLIFIVSVILFRLLLDLNYILIISPNNDYDQFLFQPSNIILSWISLTILICLTLPYLKKSLSFISIFILFIFFFKIVPFTSYIYCGAISLDLDFLELIYYSLFLILCRFVPGFRIPSPHYSPLAINIITISFIAVILIISGVYAKFRIHLSLLDVYELREESRGYHVPIILQYLHNAASKVLPILLIYYLERKNKIMCIGIIFAVLLSFGVNGLKSTFLNLIICLLLFFFQNYRIIKKISVIFLYVVLIALIEYFTTGTFWIDQLLIRRMFFMPSLIDTYYFHYINEHGPLLFKGEVNGTDISFIIGGMWRNEECRANNGLFSDAYSNLKYLGVFLYPLLYALLFKTFAIIIDRKQFIIRYFAAFIIANVMLSSFLTVTLFTHGILIMCIVIMFMPNINNKKYYELQKNSIVS